MVAPLVAGCTVKAGAADAASPERVTKKLDLISLNGVAVDGQGAVYATGTLVAPRVFDSFSLAPGGGTDVFVGRYGADGKAAWARRFGDVGEQQPNGIAVTADGTVAVVGSFTGRIDDGPVHLSGTAEHRPFLMGLRASDGAPRWGHAFDLGPGGTLAAVAAHPSRDLVAVCGYATTAATGLVPAAKSGGDRDVVIAAFDSSGKRLWARQIGGKDVEECLALAVDDRGDIFAAGRYSGELNLRDAPLPNPGGRHQRWLWMARIDGKSGEVLAASSASGPGLHRPFSLAVAGRDLVVCGSLSGKLALPLAEAMTGAGYNDAFVARLDPAANPPFSARWAVRLGGPAPDECHGVTVDADGNVVATGFFGVRTSGAATLASVEASPDAFLLLLDGNTGKTLRATSVGDRHAQFGRAVAVGRRSGGGKPFLVFGGEFLGQVDFGPATSLRSDEAAVFLDIGGDWNTGIAGAMTKEQR